MTDVDLYRITVRAHRSGSSAAVDLVLPAEMELGELMPCIVDLVGEQFGESLGGTERWTLSQVDGSTLKESMTLSENGVRDGGLLLLTTEAVTYERTFADMSHYVVDASRPPDRDAGWSQRLAVLAWGWSAGVGGVTLVWPSHLAQGNRAVAAAIVTIAAAVAAVIGSRTELEPNVALSSGATAVAFGAMAGYLLVPGGPAPPNFFLAAAISSAISAVLLNVTSRESVSFIAIAAFSSVVAIAAASATVWPVPTATLGAVLATASLAMLSLAAKVSIFVTGLSPRMPDDASDALGDYATVPVTAGVERAQRGHHVLTGLLAGFSLSAALGTVLIIADEPVADTWVRFGFAAAMAVALIFRACQQHGAARRALVLLSGLISATAAFALVVVSAPKHAFWVCLLAVALGATALCLTRVSFGSRLSPFARRGVEFVDYLALAAVVPMAAWICGVYGLVRGLSLT
jgi:type VII secretion integral membrane protein EccD